jgi:hypothetical protein
MDDPKETIQEQVIKFANNDNWSFRINKSKMVGGIQTFYMCCSNALTPGIKCPVKKTICLKGNVLELTGGPRHSHNHDPPGRQRLDSQVKEAIQIQARNHVQPEQIRANF